MKEDTLDAIYSALTTDQIEALDTYDHESTETILHCIEDFHNAGIPLYTAIDLAFNAFREA
jgi:hypothetical protein